MVKRRMLDLFCGRFGWGKAFSARGWEVVGVDLVQPPEVPEGCRFMRANILDLTEVWIRTTGYGPFDFICASSPCEQFSVHGMKLFHPNPPYPELGIRLFNHTRSLCEASGLPYVMENVRAAQQFVGDAVNHCGPFYLWGNSVPTIMPQGISKGSKFGKWTRAERKLNKEAYWSTSSKSKGRAEVKAKMATIPPELASCVAGYAERITECVA